MTLGILAFSEGPLSSLGKQDAIAVVTGQALTVALGAEVVKAGATVVETGQDLNLTLGDETVVTTSVAAVTGQEITSALGTATAVAVANPTVSVSGFGLNVVIGTFAVTAGGQVFLHYNNKAGQFQESNAFDGRPMLGLPSYYKKAQ